VTLESHGEDDERRARLRGRRIGLGVVMVVAVSFIAVSTTQIVRAVFGLATTSLAPGRADSPQGRCAIGIRRLARTLDRPVGVEPPASGPATGAGWTDTEAVDQACRKASGGLDAWAALLRLRAAEQQLAQASEEDLQPLRREVAAHLPADLR
jgi:hypothetical protein